MGEVFATGSYESPIGALRIAVTRQGVARLGLPHASGAGFRAWLPRFLPDAEEVKDLPLLEQVRSELQEYFGGARRSFSLPLDLRGTPFQVSVWESLIEIPFGETCSYADVARRIERPNAYRAVGLASGANPVPLVVPCHRVIASGGGLGGYAGGAEAKRKLLAFEQARATSHTLL